MKTAAFTQFLRDLSPAPLRVLTNQIPFSAYKSINLSGHYLNSKEIHLVTVTDWSAYLKTYCQTHKADVVFGGYKEVRGLYNRSSHFNDPATSEKRNIHLGMDLWVAAGTPIYAPLDGVLHSFANNARYGDYGPTLILEHRIKAVTFYTLYGHLSLASLNNKTVGMSIKQGMQIGTLGTPHVNGDYAPHLHFQIIKDLQGWEGDYPGVCGASNLAYFSSNCPDPNLLLKLPDANQIAY
ncbi:peptidoglycan DD-metalloendopeptidase family protein [Bizionia sediminis]|uniref:Peptidoglycan DD-metalloendopeptidase family protein n=1 Tax=Bizionia sediminis TaxID=1737064 RepID=A0ABW5KN08_9FLAO